MRVVGLLLLLSGLTGCNQSVDEQIQDRLQNTKTVFAEQLEEQTDRIKENTYDKNGIFGFAAVLKTDNEKEFELIVSNGGVKMITISNAKYIKDNLHEMTKIVHSVKIK